MYFVYHCELGSTKIIKDVIEPSFHDFVKTTKGPTKIHGSRGVFCNTLAEVRQVEMFSEYIFDDDITVPDFHKMIENVATELTKIKDGAPQSESENELNQEKDDE